MRLFIKIILNVSLCSISTSSLFAVISGKEVYNKSCMACHGANGGGMPGPNGGPNLTILKKIMLTNKCMRSWMELEKVLAARQWQA